MQHLLLLPAMPPGLIDIKSVLWKSGGVHQTKIAVLGVVGGGLTDVVDAAPQELAQIVGVKLVRGDAGLMTLGAPAGAGVPQAGTLQVVIHQQGLGQGEMVNAPALYHGGGLTAIDHPVRVGGVVLVIQAFAVVVAHNIQQGGAFLGVFPGHIVGAEGGQAVLPGVVEGNLFQQLFHGFQAALVHMGIVNFVANAPKQQAGVVPIPAHPAGHVLFVPRREEPGVVIGGLAPHPIVKGLVHHQNAHFVRQLHHPGSGRIVGGAQGIDAHFLHDLQLTPGGTAVEGRTQAAQVVVQAYPVEDNAPVVQQQPIVRGKLQAAEAADGFHAVQLLPLPQQLRPQGIAAGGFQGPEPGIGHFQLRLSIGPGLDGGHRVPLPVQQGIDNAIGIQGLFGLRRNRHPPAPRAKLPRGDIEPVSDQVGVRVFQHPHIPVKPSPGIPAGVGVAHQAAHQHLVLPGGEEIGDIRLEGGIAVFPFRRQSAVDKQGGIHIHALEIQAAPPSRCPGELLPIPAGAVLVQFLHMPNLPVVGQGHLLPALLPLGQGFAAVGIHKKLPIVIPKRFRSHLSRSLSQKVFCLYSIPFREEKQPKNCGSVAACCGFESRTSEARFFLASRQNLLYNGMENIGFRQLVGKLLFV